MKYYIFTLGCQYNIYESEEIEKTLRNLGLKKAADEKSATFIICNICSVRQKPIDRIYGKLKVWGELKLKNPNLRTIGTGCVLPRDRKIFKQRFDLVFDIGDLKKLQKFIKNEISGLNSISKLKKVGIKNSGLVPITSGCNNFCTYCAVPYTRGRERSFSKKQIIEKVRESIQNNSKEIILLGQNVNSYKYGFSELLEEVAQIPGNFKISFLSPHPKDTNSKLIEIMAKYPKIKKELHLPLQSGNNKILKLMNRNYTKQDYEKLVKMIRSIIPNIYLSTDLIVGFPGETKKQFEETYRFCKKMQFDKAFVSMYSSRPGTEAEKKLKDNISPKEKRSRWLKLDKLINKKIF
ncbi:MiaB/RimO family radical SAM methylthiotransferase [Patescibacteria group bacterium]